MSLVFRMKSCCRHSVQGKTRLSNSEISFQIKRNVEDLHAQSGCMASGFCCPRTLLMRISTPILTHLVNK